MDVSGALSLVKSVIEVLGSPIWWRIEGVLGLESRLDKLRETMSTIEAVLLDAEEQEQLQHYRCSRVERNRLQRLKEALYRCDDLFDEIATLGHLKELNSCNNKVCNEACLFFSRSNQLNSAFNWSQEMDNILEMLEDIVKDHRHNFSLRHPVGLDAKQMRIDARETHSFVCEEKDEIIGRADDKQKVIDKLLNTAVEQDVFVVSIVGIGGLGKTTLAQQVYNDEMIVKKFTRKLWVCVSDDFNVKVLLGKILAAANPKNPVIKHGLSKDHLQMKLREELDGQNYLLVLDDVWNEDLGKWLELRNLLSGDGRVCKILVTTRSKKVADVVGSHCPHWTHELMGLSDEDSWTLFQRMALKHEEHPLKSHLIDVGKDIVRKCANVPLAIRVVGSLLRGQGKSKWKILKNTDLANIVQDEINGIIPVLKISYNYLPFHLKSCFSYCAVLPKDYMITKEHLICLWMAQGFIMPSDGESFEDVGEEYFEQLLQRCFFQDDELAKGTDEIRSFKMHDLIHDLAKEVAGKEILSCNYSKRCFNEKTRHVFISGSIPKEFLGDLTKMKRVRTFLCYVLPFSFKSLVVEVSKMKYLRVLCLTHNMKTLPSQLGEFLRYLDLSFSDHLCVLPSSITKLYNLQTLELFSCTKLLRLPRDLSKLVNLRHLNISGCKSLTHMPPGMNSMKSLQKLTMFVVSGSGRSNASWNLWSTGVGQLEDLDDFTNYTHTMEIIVKKGVGYVAIEATGGGMLLNCQNLLEIEYRWEEKNNNAEELLQGLQPHSNLRKLELCEYPGVRLPIWMMNLNTCLPNLVRIGLHFCQRLEHLTLMSQLRHLKVLELAVLNEVEYVEGSSSNNSGDEDESVFFPSLEKLKLFIMPKLNGWWKSSSESRKGESPQAAKLSHLNIRYCSNLKTFPFCPEFDGVLGSSMNLSTCLPNLVKIKIYKCYRLEYLPWMRQLRHLKVLELEGLDVVEYVESRCNTIGGADDDELLFFPSLEKLKLIKMPKLKGWWKSESECETPQALMLSHLIILNCPNLTTFPLCPGLEELELIDFNEALGPIMRETTHDLSNEKQQQQDDKVRPGRLREVKKIDNVGYLNSMPIHSFHHLSNLCNCNDDKMERLNIGAAGEVFRSCRLSSLRCLIIEKCRKLKSISGRGVWEHFTALESLKLYDLEELELEGEDDVINNESTEEGCIKNEVEMPWRHIAPTLRSLE
ncbi:putative disease resistance protein RGA1 [Chenopodium quinoa]|uniref:Uncharacterized protein n=1 Tax=Chenopodium quinoa TaxID=63459 RepID=A0A803LGM5_CHEQI|nr:putative disease resistance protein RGA1 [Chenopodium quinoa]XP_021776255.1 putative disease resistance protein RGA1 [Chenopodium quinoa]